MTASGRLRTSSQGGAAAGSKVIAVARIECAPIRAVGATSPALELQANLAATIEKAGPNRYRLLRLAGMVTLSGCVLGLCLLFWVSLAKLVF